VWRILAHARAAMDCLSRRHECASVSESGGITQAESAKLQKRLLNGRFYGAQILMCRAARRLLTANPGARAARKRGVRNTGFAPQKKIERISPKSAM